MSNKAGYIFQVHFDNFGTGDAAQHLSDQVLRVTRPGVVFFNAIGLDEVEALAIEIDLADDMSDRVRAEVVTQIAKQIKTDARFKLIIETHDTERRVLEQWYLRDCRITECRFDELGRAITNDLAIHLVVTGSLATNAYGELVELLD